MPKRRTGPNCGVQAAADDQLVAVELDHRLDTHAQEMLAAAVVGDRRSRSLDRLGGHSPSRQIELHAADVSLVGDRLGMELEDHREAD